MASASVDDAQVRQLLTRRSAIDQLTTEIERLGPDADDEAVAALLTEALASAPLEALAHLRGGTERLVRQSLEEHRHFTPSPASNAASPAGMVRILLLQNLDLLWWDEAPDFETAAEIETDASLLDLIAERRAGRVAFGFGIAPRGLLGRGRDFVVQRVAPSHQPQGPGLSCTKIRPAMLGVLNEISLRAAARTDWGVPPIWVTSITRTVEHQLHLRSLGFSALDPSAHCRGWAADIEVRWYERFGAAEILKGVLLEYLEAGVLNVIDEGRAWHICLNPSCVSTYEPLGR